MNAADHQKVIADYPLAPTRVCSRCHIKKLIAYFEGDDWCMACRRKHGKEARERSWYRQVQKVRA